MRPPIPPPPDFDALEDLPPLQPSDAEFEALLPTDAEMAVITGKRYLPKDELADKIEEATTVLATQEPKDIPPSFSPVSKPQAVAWDSPRKATWKRHPKCTVDKCARGIFGPCCDFCIKLNAKGF